LRSRRHTVVGALPRRALQQGGRHPRRHGSRQVSTGALRKRAPRVEHVMRARLRILALLMVAALLAGTVWARLAYWQVLRHVQLSASAQAQYHELVQL